MPAFEPVTKFNATVDDVARFPEWCGRHFASRPPARRARAPAVPRQRGAAGSGRGRDGSATEPQFARVPPFRPAPDEAACGRRSPLAAGRAAGDCRRRRGAPRRRRPNSLRSPRRCRSRSRPRSTARIDPGRASGSRSASCGSYSRESANRVVNRADLVCFIGTETGGMTTHFWAVPKMERPRSRSTSIRRRSGATIRWSRWSTATPR